MSTETKTPPEQPQRAEPQTIKEVLNPSHTALIVTDMQNDFLHPNGFFARKPGIVGGDFRNMQAIVPHVKKMIQLAREAGVLIVFTKGYEDVKYRSGPDAFRAKQWDEHDGDGSVNSESGTWGAEFYEGIEPRQGDIILEKHRWSPFSGREQKPGESYDPNDTSRRTLDEILDQHGIKTVVDTGVVAETCIETGIRDGYERGYYIVVPEKSVGSNNPDQLDARMKYWRKGFVATVVSEEEIEGYWKPTQTGLNSDNIT